MQRRSSDTPEEPRSLTNQRALEAQLYAVRHQLAHAREVIADLRAQLVVERRLYRRRPIAAQRPESNGVALLRARVTTLERQVAELQKQTHMLEQENQDRIDDVNDHHEMPEKLQERAEHPQIVLVGVDRGCKPPEADKIREWDPAEGWDAP